MKTCFGGLLGLVMLTAACSPSDETIADTGVEKADASLSEVEDNDTPAPGEEAAATDYADMANWLCHPGKADDACDVDLTYTVVEADGSTSVEAFEASENPPIDCFYIYPTVSFDETPNSDLVPGDEELRVVETQFARFAEECRLFAPMYRQITLPELRRGLSGQGFTADLPMRYSDIKGAWDNYLENDNDGRGVVIIGHSQGSSMIHELLRQDIIGSKAENHVISVMPIGMTTYGDASTGNFGPFEPCTVKSQTGCMISYVSFRSTVPPPAGSRFGVNSMDGRRAICVNPAELSGDDGILDARLSAQGWYGNTPTDFANGEGVDTPFAAVPGLLTAQCVEGEKHTYLEITVNGDPADPRADDIVGDVINDGEVLADWGLHLIDMNAAMGNLVDIVSAQSDAWVAAQATNQ